MPGLIEDDFLKRALVEAETPLALLLVDEGQWSTGLGGLSNWGLTLSASDGLAALLEGEGVRVARVQGWGAMTEATQRLEADCVFFPPMELAGESSGARRAWALDRQAEGVSLVAYDWGARRHLGPLGDENERLGFAAESCLFYLPGAAQTLAASARAGRARRDRADWEARIEPAPVRGPRSI